MEALFSVSRTDESDPGLFLSCVCFGQRMLPASAARAQGRRNFNHALRRGGFAFAALPGRQRAGAPAPEARRMRVLSAGISAHVAGRWLGAGELSDAQVVCAEPETRLRRPWFREIQPIRFARPG